MKIVYICTNYNNSYVTIDAVFSFLRNAPKDTRCIVVDNCSSEPEKQLLSRGLGSNSQVDVLFEKHNHGYFGGLNIGLQYMKKYRKQYLYAVIGNNDLLFENSFIYSIENSLDLFNTYPVVAPSIIKPNGEHQNPHVIHKISKARRILYDIYFIHYQISCVLTAINSRTSKLTRRRDEDHHEIRQEISQGHGACYLLGPIFFEKIKKLDAPTLLFGEELFLSKQLEKLGYKIIYEPSIQVLHVCNKTIGELPSRKRWDLLKQAYRMEKKFLK